MVVYIKKQKGGDNMGIKSKVYRDAKLQAIWERNQRLDADCLEMLSLLTMLGILALLTFC